MPGYRQSALVLHGLSEADQRWILARVEDDDQRVLGAHLTELKSLGIPADPALTEAAASASATMGPTNSSRRPIAADPLMTASAAQVGIALADEPIWLVRQVLALEDWPWRQEFLASLAPGRRERLTPTNGAPISVSGKLAECLRAHLSSRLVTGDFDGATDQAVQASRNLLPTLRQAVRRWL